MKTNQTFPLLLLAGLMVSCGDPRCTLKPEPGPCEAAFEKYFFDQASKKCAAFTWGGCQGVVPFDTLAECQAACE